MPLFWTWLALALAWLAPARADPLRWQGPVEADHVVLIEVLYHEPGSDGPPSEQLVARFLSSDGTDRSQAGWRPDLDPRRGQVRLEVPELWLAPGNYIERIHLEGSAPQLGGRSWSGTGLPSHDDGIRDLPLQTTISPPRLLAVSLPLGATGVRALRFTQGAGHDGWAYAPALGRIAFLPLGAGTWTATAMGSLAEPTASVDIDPAATSLRFQPQRALPPRTPSGAHPLLFALGLVPVTALIAGMGLLAAWRARRLPGLGLALLLALSVGLVAISAVLPDPSAALLMRGPSYTDPPNSAALVAAIADSIRHFTDHSAIYAYPDGGSWLVVGPSWLGYLPVLPLAWASDAVLAHNMGVMLGVVLLFLAAWALARDLGASSIPALLAGAGAVLAPALWQDLSAVSLDRTTLYTVPVFLLCLERAATRPGWRWPVATGVALAAAFYGQVYYGIYLAAAVPLMVLWRLVGARPLRRLARLGLAGLVAAALLAPGLLALRIGTAHTVYREEGPTLSAALEARGRSLLDPVSREQAEAFVAEHDRRHGDNLHRPMDTPGDRLLVALTNSIQRDELFQPSASLTGRGACWLLAGLGVLLASTRLAALRVLLDSLVLAVMAMGPLLLSSGGKVGGILPYYGLLLAIPGFDQLKHPDRYMLLAATISTVPIALGLDGLVRRFRASPGLLRSTMMALATLIVGFPLLTLGLRGEGDRPGFLSLDTRAWLHGLELDFSFRRPVATSFPPSSALAQIAPGPALFLPLTVPTLESQYIPALQAHLPMLNDPPYGATAGGGRPGWAEENGLLSRAAWLAGTDRPRRLLEPDTARDRAQIQAQGLRWIVLVRSALAGPELAPGLVRWMDQTFRRQAQDDDVIVWSTDPPAGGL